MSLGPEFWENDHLPPCVTFYISHVMCHVSQVTCHMSSWWRVCYQHGLPRSVLHLIRHIGDTGDMGGKGLLGSIWVPLSLLVCRGSVQFTRANCGLLRFLWVYLGYLVFTQVPFGSTWGHSVHSVALGCTRVKSDSLRSTWVVHSGPLSFTLVHFGLLGSALIKFGWLGSTWDHSCSIGSAPVNSGGPLLSIRVHSDSLGVIHVLYDSLGFTLVHLC